MIISVLAIFTNWPKCTTQLVKQGEKEIWKTVCRARGAPYGLFFGLLVIVIIEIWAIYVAEMYRFKYRELQEDESSKSFVCLKKQLLIIVNAIMCRICIKIIKPIIILFEIVVSITLHLLLQNLSILTIMITSLFICIIVFIVCTDSSQGQPTPPNRWTLH